MTLDAGPDASRDGHFGWYRALDKQERRAFWSCKIGYGLDGMDTQMLSFVIPTLIALWIGTGEAGFIHTMTLLASAAGGWIAGSLRPHRPGADPATDGALVRLLHLPLRPRAELRAVAGRTDPDGLRLRWRMDRRRGTHRRSDQARDRGKAVGLVQSGWAIGWGLTAILYSLMFSLLPPEEAWRALFMLGLLPALFVLVVRRLVKEPEIYREARQRNQGADKVSFYEIFAPGMLSITLRASLLTTGALGGYYAITAWLPTFLKTERGLTVLGTSGYLAMVILGSYVGYVVSAFLTDLIGRKKNFVLFAVGSFTVVLLYTQLPVSNGAMLWLGFPLGFFASGIFSGMGSFLTELFPTRIRGSGQGFCYNAGRAIAALFPMLIGMLGQKLSLGLGIGAFAAVSYGVVILAALSLPETRGKQLEL